MTYRAVATDYDGTLAHAGTVDDDTVESLRQARAAGLRLILVTGRELTSLFNTFDNADLFDRIVAENGAVVHNPAAASVDTLGEAPPPALIDTLQRANVPISVGRSIVATVAPYEAAMRETIAALGLRWHVILNKDAVMALPSDVNKATGLRVALSELAIGTDETIGIGDAENDEIFLRICGLSIAVSNALPSVKASADLVTDGARGAGVRETLERLMNGAGFPTRGGREG